MPNEYCHVDTDVPIDESQRRSKQPPIGLECCRLLELQERHDLVIAQPER